jgi:ligand-binding sensor domain-containing protein
VKITYRYARLPQACPWPALGSARQTLILAALFLVTGISPALDPHKAITQYIHNVWGPDNGITDGNDSVILQSRDGYLWIGTFNGLYRFDGVSFTFFDRSIAPGMGQTAGVAVKALCEGRDGSLWIGTNGAGLARMKDGVFTIYTSQEGLSNDTVRAIAEARDGSIWVGTDLGLSRFQAGKFTIFGTGDGLSSNSVKVVYEDRNGALWAGTEGGLDQFRDGAFAHYPLNLPNGEKEHKAVYAIQESREGSLWFGLYGGGLVQLKDGRQTVFTTRNGLSNNYIHSMAEDRDGNLWIGTAGGLNRLADGRFSTYTVKDGLPHNNVARMVEDREGNLWVTVDGTNPLNRFRDGKFLTYTSQEGLPGSIVYSIRQRKDGTIWIGSDAGLSEFSNGRFTAYADKQFSNHVTTIIESRDGTLWFGTKGSGLGRLKDGRLTMYTKRDGLANNVVWCLAEDDEGNVWIGTDDGLSRFQHEKLTTYTINDGLPSTMIRTIGLDRQGNIWMGGNDGLTVYKDGMFRTYRKKDGLSSDSPRALYVDQQGLLWIGTLGGGLNLFKDGHFTAVTSKQGLSENYILAIQEDDQGYLWLGGRKGVLQVNKRELEDYAAGTISSVTDTVYSRADGIRGALFSGTAPNVCKTKDGKLWIPTAEGIVVIDPDHLATDRHVPPVMIEEAITDGKRMEAGQSESVPAGRAQLEFHYTALTLSVPEKVKFKYELEGFDQNWIDAGTRRAAYYTNIAPGTYRFRVAAANSDGVWNETGASFAFRLLPHFYQTWWFYGLGVITVGLAVFIGYTMRVRQLQSGKRALELRVRELQQEMAQRTHGDSGARPPQQSSLQGPNGKQAEQEIKRS